MPSLIGWIVITWLASVAASPKLQIHHEMSNEELQRVFHVSSHDQVPEYEVVNIRSRMTRDLEGVDIRHVDLTAFGSRYNLRLERNSHLLRSGNKVRVFVADSNATDHINLEELAQDDDEEVGDVFQDDNSEAAILVNHDVNDDAIILDGTIGSELVIRPLPAKFRRNKSKSAGINSKEKERLQDDEIFLE